jgi:predicted MFS family arabinose efflux permease
MQFSIKKWCPVRGTVGVISLATGIRWIGWGMAEPLIPVFLFSLLGGYGRSAVVDGVGQLVFILILPIAGMLADKVPLRQFLIVGLVLFCFDGLWSVASATKIVALAVLANAIDGVAVASDVVGRATYIRRHAEEGTIARTMGVQNGLINLGFIIGALISIVAVRFVSLSWIFLGIVPTNCVALYLVYRIEDDHAPILTDDGAQGRKTFQFSGLWGETLLGDGGLGFLGCVVLFLNALAGVTTILLPIYAYRHGSSLEGVIVLGIMAVIPEMFGSFLGRFADHYHERLLAGGLLGIAACLGILAIIGYSRLLFVVVLLLRAVVVVVALVIEKSATRRTDPNRYGRISAALEGLKDVGKFGGAVVLGFGIDHFGATSMFTFLAGTSALFGILVRLRTRSGANKAFGRPFVVSAEPSQLDSDVIETL